MAGHGRYRGMSNKRNPRTDPDEPTVYQIRIEGLTITLEDNGDTLLTGPVVDQTALHGLLRKVRDLGMPLISVIQSEKGEQVYPYSEGKTP